MADSRYVAVPGGTQDNWSGTFYPGKTPEQMGTGQFGPSAGTFGLPMPGMQTSNTPLSQVQQQVQNATGQQAPIVTQPFLGPFQGSTQGVQLPNSLGGGLLGQTNPLGSTSTLGVDMAAQLARLAGNPIIPAAQPAGPIAPTTVSNGPPGTLTPEQSQGLSSLYGASPAFAPQAPNPPTIPQAPPGPPAGAPATPRPPTGPTGGRPDANVPGPPADANTGLPVQNLDQAIAAAAGALGGVVGPPAAGSNQFPTVGGGQAYQSTFGLPIPRGGQGPQRRGY